LYSDKGKYFPNRVKQWLGYLSRQYQQAEQLFMQIRTLHNAQQIIDKLKHFDAR
jgi:tRNA-dihydrouridine synthase C